MSETQVQRSRLEAENSPVAIIKSGVHLFANQKYLQQFELNSSDELRQIPVAKLIVDEDQERFEQFLQQSELENPRSKRPQEKTFTMKSVDGKRFAVAVRLETTTFEDELCVQLSLRVIETLPMPSNTRSSAWGYYFSIVLLVYLFTQSIYILLQLDINNAPSVYFPPDEPAVVAEVAAREYFPTDQVIVMMFEGEGLFSDEFLITYNRLVTELEGYDMVDKVMSVTTQDHISGTADGFMIGPVIDIDNLKESLPSERAEIILADRFSRGALISKEADALSMVIVPKSAESSFARLELMDEISTAIADSHIEGYLTAVAGEMKVDVAMLHSMIRDNLTFIPLTTLIGLTLIWLLFRRILAVVISGVVLGVVVASTMSIYVLVGQPFTLIASISPPLLSALTIATLVHLFNAIQFASQRGLVGKARIKMALNEIYRPALFTSLTTAAGLASLGASPIPPIAAFGIVASCGTVLIFFMVMYVVPQLLIRLDNAAWPARQGGLAWMDHFVRSMCHIGIRYPLPVIGVTLLMMLLGISQLGGIKVETNLQEFFSSDHEVRRSSDHIDKTLVGTMPTEVMIRSEEVDGLTHPEVLRELKDFQDWAETIPQIDKTVSLVDFVEDMNWGFNEEDEKFRKIPDDVNLIRQYLLMYDGQDMFDLVDRDYKTTLINMNLNVHSANDISATLDQVKGYLDEHLDKSLSWNLVGVGRVFSDLEDLLVRGQIYSLGSALVLIFGLMLILWRSFWQAVICMLPNLTPVLLIFVFMGMFSIWLDMATAMIASVAVGIAVDDTIHIFHGFIKRVNQGISPVTALLRTTSLAGRAVMTTTIILATQFMITVLSQFIPTRNFGVLTSVGLITALLFDLIVLPALLIVIYRKKTVQASVRQQELPD